MAARTRGRRRWLVLGLGLALLALAAAWIDRQLQPQRLTATVLEQIGSTQGLEFSISGEPDYALRPEPRLVLPHLQVRQPGTDTPLLIAERAEIALPWATVLDGDAALVITRLELDHPVLDLAALRRWQATRPPTPFELPTLTRGLRVVDGRVADRDWSLQALNLELDRLAKAQPTTLQVRTRWQVGEQAGDLSARVEMARAAVASALKINAQGHWQQGSQALPFVLALQGAYDDADGQPALLAEQFTLDSESPLPDFAGQGHLRYGDDLGLALAGELMTWPEDWPALPPPLSASTATLAVSLDYRGEPDFSGPLQLDLARDDSRVELALRLPQVQAWLAAPEGPPLPPITGSLTAPAIEIDGATLEGVRIELSDDPATPPSP